MSEKHQSLDSGAPASAAWAWRARIVAFAAWALAALTAGVTAALAKDAFLTAWPECWRHSRFSWRALCGAYWVSYAPLIGPKVTYTHANWAKPN